ncbi:hypothetical protein ACFWI0_25945, partial [[Kitasatospora] papulosa]
VVFLSERVWGGVYIFRGSYKYRVPATHLFAYTGRILATPGALLIKESDLAHNADPDRLAVLEPATRTRLTEKYAQVRGLLGLDGGAGPTERRDQANPAAG